MNEIKHYNILLDNIVEELRKDKIKEDLNSGKVPKVWQEITHSTEKSLTNWLEELAKKVEFMRDWMTKGEPKVYYLPALLFPKSFLAGIMELHAREKKVPLEKVELEFTVLKDMKEGYPKDGIVMDGFYLKNAAWDEKKGILEEEHHAKNMHVNKMPPIVAKAVTEVKEDDKGYVCPVYKGKKVVMEIDLPTNKSVDYWHMKGVSMLLELNNE